MKIGQILSYMAGFVPEQYQDVYRTALAELRTTSPSMPRDRAEAVLTEDFGQGVEQLFDDFDWTPMAAASIGQVYAARFEGRQVCVKVQYPGIKAATESDLKNIGAIVQLMGVVVPTVDARQIVDDFRNRLREECDYQREASYQARFAAIYADDRGVKVPRVIEQRCSEHVLTTERIYGTSLETFAARAPAHARSAAAESLFRFAFGTLLHHGLFHADPHPGNLLFGADESERIGILDFGCVQPIDREAQAAFRGLLQAAVDGADLAPPAVHALGIEKLDTGSRDAVARIATELLAPVRKPQPYRFGTEFAADIGRYAVQAKADLSFRYLTRRGYFGRPRPGAMFVVRTLFGLASLWSTLQATVHFRRRAEDILAAPEPTPGR